MAYCKQCNHPRTIFDTFCVRCSKPTECQDSLDEATEREQEYCGCPGCRGKSLKVTLYCSNCWKLIGFAPRWWISTALILAPLAMCVGLTLWRNDTLVYVLLSVGILFYLGYGFRDFRNVRSSMLWWLIPMMLLIGVFGHVTSPQHFFLGAIAALYLLVLAVVLAIHMNYWLGKGAARTEILLAGVSITLTIYSFVVELACRLGLTGEGDSAAWQRAIASLLWTGRGVLALLAGVFLVVGAAVRISGESLMPKAGKSNIIWKLSEYAESFFRAFWDLLLETWGLLVKVQLGFLANAILPLLLAAAASFSTLLFSRVLFSYLADIKLMVEGDSALVPPARYVAFYAATMAGSVLAFAHVEYARVFCSRARLASPLVAKLPRYVSSVFNDVSILIFHLSYVIPSSVVVLYFISQRMGLAVLYPGMGFFSLSFTLLLFVLLLISLFRRLLRV